MCGHQYWNDLFVSGTKNYQSGPKECQNDWGHHQGMEEPAS